MYQAFLDDSGSGPPVFVLSGYVSLNYWWEDFSEEWKALLDEAPRLKYFKMNEAAQLSGEFHGMGIEARNKRLEKFLKLIQIASHQSVSSVIPYSPYRRIVKGKIKKHWDDPYFIALWDVTVMLITGMASLKVDGSIDSASVLDFIFDDHPRLAAKVPAWYQMTRALLHPEVRNSIATTPRFENDQNLMPLQAADAQSWYYRRVFAERFKNEPFKPDLPKELFKPLDSVPAAMNYWSSKRMQYFVEVTNNPKLVKHERMPDTRFRDIHDVVARADLT